MAAAAWSCVEKILQLAQRTVAPRSTSVSISTAVWMVMCREPVTRTPSSGLSGAYFLRIAIRPGISYSATEISLRPQSARARSATLYSAARLVRVAALIKSPWNRLIAIGSGYVAIILRAYHLTTLFPLEGSFHGRSHAAYFYVRVGDRRPSRQDGRPDFRRGSRRRDDRRSHRPRGLRSSGD